MIHLAPEIKQHSTAPHLTPNERPPNIAALGVTWRKSDQNMATNEIQYHDNIFIVGFVTKINKK